MVRGIPLVIALVAACGGTPTATMSDAQLLWCGEHNMTPIQSIGSFAGTVDNAVLEAARKLGITIPPDIETADTIFIGNNLTGDDQSLNSLPDWVSAMKAWAKTADYARACIAAFDSR
jgi:hypothetical protein